MSESKPERDRSTEPLVRVDGLRKYFYERDTLLDRLFGNEPVAVQAVDGVSFDIRRGETLGLVGESGCGKSTAGETLLQLQEPTEGTVEFDGRTVSDDADESFRRQAQIVFQDPYSSLDPRMTVGEIVRQPLAIHGIGDKEERRRRARELLERVGLSADQLDRYPHEFSGGQRQRIGIARALALEPEFVVLDEPTSALDVSVQAQVLNLLDDLQTEFSLTYLLISHDLSVIRHNCDRVAVMYLGEIVEIGPVDEIFESPQHPYTEALLDSVPRASVDEHEREVTTLSGDVPSPRNPPSGCRFRTRCPKVIQPENYEFDQETWRSVMDLRERIERRDVSVEGIRERLDDETVAGAIREEHGIGTLSDPDAERVLEEALSAVANGEFEAAEATLRGAFETVCESERPSLVGENRDHPAACHLHDERFS
ncbi:ABC transporter ATP-binding protein [Halalkalicoccus ordinarius]|uniref:ABC transporter ATP-binding protein n=1 Tax=Halalkalicoccus ordinarius TaxID=3116651 RepID=UPI00300EF29F